MSCNDAKDLKLSRAPLQAWIPRLRWNRTEEKGIMEQLDFRGI